ncbi:low affinity immunoglobulin gamma Fc region receptor II-like [Mugil cephalus]|uniref:low affinity immunoglobulin gamma Fc region receptor II-like n=1 Tax=Mugil cephalus TaxID=48193 RepID=UPI001FB69605|nr:low affinity immunoglobulin gamma Fc region receptor II-like [Mugil cephalus]
MKVGGFCTTLLTVTILLCAQDQEVDGAFVRISPNRLQFFEYESVTLYCKGVFDCDVESTSKGRKPSCCTTDDITFRGPNCTIENIYREDSGKYWCLEGRQRRNIININVTSGFVILESPALPVMEGEDVTLSCRTKNSSSNIQADFYKDGVLKWTSSTGSMIIKTVSMSDQGFYKCHISGVGESLHSWLSLRALLSSSTPYFQEELNLTSPCKCNEHGPSPDHSCHIYPILRTVFTIIMVVVVVVLLGCLHCVFVRDIKHD